jgi:large subunit ribosomal protein L13
MNGPSYQTIRLVHRFNASEKHTIGRMAGRIAVLLMGKHKPTYSGNMDHGDHVIVTNAKDLKFSGRKYGDKLYRWHTGYPGGLKQTTPRHLVEIKDRPEELLTRAVWGMLPKNRLRRPRMDRLKVFKEEEQEKINSRRFLRSMVYLGKHPGGQWKRNAGQMWR